MDRDPAPDVRGYSRVEIDDFVASVAEERTRLERAITEDEERARTARAALGTHRVMVSMLLQTQREIDEIRARAEAEAAVLLASSSMPAASVLDISRLEQVTPIVRPVPSAPTAARPEWTTDDSADYFDFLRGALVDDAPLGPRPESA